MSLLSNLKSDSGIKEETDVLGGGGVLDTDIYATKIALAYVSKAESGALGLNLVFKTEENRDLRQTFWMSSGDAKGNKNYYEKDGVKHYLPGYNMANSLCLLTLGKEIGVMDTEDKVVKLYSFEAKAEVPTKVAMITELLGQDIYVAVQKQIVDKTAKDDKGVYQPTGETREENEVVKMFRAKDKLTTAEIRAKAEKAEFFDNWLDQNKGKTRNRAKGAAAGGTAGAPKGGSSGGSTKPTTSLFGS